MSEAGSSIFTDADGYQASLRDILDLLVLCPRKFHARLSWVELPHLRLLRAHESSGRVVFLRVPRDQAFACFSTRLGRPLLHGGVALQFGDFAWHGADARIHQRTPGDSRWGSIAVDCEALAWFGRTLVGRTPSLPTSSLRIVRPAPVDGRRLVSLHARAIRIAETDPNRIVNPEIVRALEQELMTQLVKCLTEPQAYDDNPARDQQARYCVQFEQILGAHSHGLLATREICEAIGTSEARFRASCQRLLGMGPGRYQRLRRLKLLRGELRDGHARGRDIAEILTRYGFADLHRFVTEYWQAYGEMPPIPPRQDAPGKNRRLPELP